jgi:hypothetical protein
MINIIFYFLAEHHWRFIRQIINQWSNQRIIFSVDCKNMHNINTTTRFYSLQGMLCRIIFSSSRVNHKLHENTGVVEHSQNCIPFSLVLHPVHLLHPCIDSYVSVGLSWRKKRTGSVHGESEAALSTPGAPPCDCFFRNGGKSFASFDWLRRSFTRNLNHTTKAYSPGIILPNLFAPARTHKRASHLIFSTITKVGECLLRKTLALRSFHTSKTARRVREANALQWGEGPATKSDHHSLMPRPAHCLGATREAQANP